MEGLTVLNTATLNNGQAQYATSSLSVGNHVISAVYEEQGNFQSSTAAISVDVAAWTTTTALTFSPSSPSSTDSVTFTATVTSSKGTPSGDVQFKQGSTVLSTSTLDNGVATFQTSSLSLGSNTIVALYVGSTSFQSSSKDVVVSIKATTSIVLAFSPSSPTTQTPITLTSTISTGSGTPSGNVEFKEGTTVLATSAVTGSGIASTTATLGVGSHSISAKYLGDGTHFESTSNTILITVAAPEVNCPTIPPINFNLDGTCTQTVASSTCNLYCKVGYQGSKVLTCGSNGAWGTTSGTCTPTPTQICVPAQMPRNRTPGAVCNGRSPTEADSRCTVCTPASLWLPYGQQVAAALTVSCPSTTYVSYASGGFTTRDNKWSLSYSFPSVSAFQVSASVSSSTTIKKTLNATAEWCIGGTKYAYADLTFVAGPSPCQPNPCDTNQNCIVTTFDPPQYRCRANNPCASAPCAGQPQNTECVIADEISGTFSCQEKFVSVLWHNVLIQIWLTPAQVSQYGADANGLVADIIKALQNGFDYDGQVRVKVTVNPGTNGAGFALFANGDDTASVLVEFEDQAGQASFYERVSAGDPSALPGLFSQLEDDQNITVAQSLETMVFCASGTYVAIGDTCPGVDKKGDPDWFRWVLYVGVPVAGAIILILAFCLGRYCRSQSSPAALAAKEEAAMLQEKWDGFEGVVSPKALDSPGSQTALTVQQTSSMVELTSTDQGETSLLVASPPSPIPSPTATPQPSPPATPAPPPRTMAWERRYDSGQGAYYYYNIKTGVSQWDMPEDYMPF
eukprot:TRINITY_DN2418_c0_g2_i2.p1 TRINITY_DN2418_c0_g2~~TRINITY_DN2418_c0_g2_i2.p1  ORF type:complete len:870 (+),score=123.75 TRINITY_DN2418_c0_g2_i2:229-2610(+)